MLLVGIGTRGDVEPAVRLGAGLEQQGARVQVAVLADGADRVRWGGLEPVVVGPSSGEVMWWRSARARDLSLRHPGLMYLQTRSRLAGHAQEVAAGLLPLLPRADLVVCGLAAAGLVPILQRSGRSARLVLHAPLLPHPGGTSAWDSGFGDLLPRPVEAARQRLMWTLTQGLSAALTRALGHRLGTGGSTPTGRAPAAGPPAPAPLLSTSPVLDPRPSPGSVQTGWWADPSPPRPLRPEIAAWLDRHPDAVLLSLGSIAQRDAEEQVARLVQVSRAAGVPAVVQVHGARPGPRGESRARPGDPRAVGALVVPDVDHRSLLPRVRAVVHHGGSGTTHAVTAAGLPQLVVPRLGDQPHYGRQVHRAGLGPAPVPSPRACVPTLTGALVDLLENTDHARSAAAAAVRMATEDGLSRAVHELAVGAARPGARSGVHR